MRNRTCVIALLALSTISVRAASYVECNNTGAAYRASGRLDAAERAYLEALRLATQTLGPDHPEVARILGNLGELNGHRNALIRANEQFVRALAILEPARTTEPKLLGVLLGNYAEVQRKLGNLAEATALNRRALRLLPGNDPFRAVVFHNLAAIQAWDGDLQGAADSLRRAIQVSGQLAPAGSTALAHHRRDLDRVVERMRSTSARPHGFRR